MSHLSAWDFLLNVSQPSKWCEALGHIGQPEGCDSGVSLTDDCRFPSRLLSLHPLSCVLSRLQLEEFALLEADRVREGPGACEEEGAGVGGLEERDGVF